MSEQEKTLQKESTPPAGLYLHIPFCSSKCPYCDFYSIASPSLIPRWLDALKKEIVHYKERFAFFDTVYLGGGTPSILPVDSIGEILESVNQNYNISAGAEITMEANPGDLDQERIKGIKGLGVNRINLGVQSFNDDELLFLGRRHRAADSVRVLNGLRDAGFENIGIDLIYGLKDQPIEGWMQALEKAVALKPEHISCYQLTIEGKTLFNVMKNRGELKDLPEDLACSFFLEASSFLEKHGYVHYEVSNYSRGVEFISRHNSKYWKRVPYLGLGPSAHSFDGEKRWWNFRSVKKYCDSLENNITPVDDYEILSDSQARLEKISLGLRTIEGIEKEDLINIPGGLENIEKLKHSGYLEIVKDRIIPTKKGLLVADQLPLHILNDD